MQAPTQSFSSFRSRPVITVLAFQMQETGTYNLMYQRPMIVRADGENIDALIRRIDSNGSRRVNPSALSGVSYDLVAPSAHAGAPINILNGWENKRIRFILHVLIEYPGSQLTAEEYYFQGFTDYAGVSLNGSLDPHMVLIINNYVKVGQYMSYDNVGGTHLRRKIDEAAQIINGEIVQTAFGGNSFSLRPNDICTGMQSLHIQNNQIDQIPLYDTRFQLNTKSLKSNKFNVTPASYLATVTDAYCMANLSGLSQFENLDVYERAKNMISSDNIHENPFFKAIKSIRGFGNGTVFTVSDLEYLDPNTSRVANCLTVGTANRTGFHMQGQSEYWDGATIETQYATILGNAVPALLMELMISKMSFMATNHVAYGEAAITLLDGISITGTDITQFFEMFKDRFVKEIMNDITYNNQIKYNLTMHVDVFGDTVIDIQLDNGVIRYTIPTFCDSVITPMATTNYNQFTNMTTGIEQVLVNVQDAIGQDYASINRSYGLNF